MRAEEGAGRTAIPSLPSSFRFLEEAGEVAREDWLSLHPAVVNAAKEAANQTTKGKGQAPALPLMVLIGSEDVVRDEHRPLYHRAFAWYRLLRHWAALGWDDSQGLVLASLQRRARGV